MFIEIAAGKMEGGVMKFFCMQALGIWLEEKIQTVYRLTSSIKTDESPKIWARIVGYLWLLVFLVWTTPGWSYPNKGRIS